MRMDLLTSLDVHRPVRVPADRERCHTRGVGEETPAAWADSTPRRRRTGGGDEVERHRRLRLKARGWPTGEAEVEIITEATGSGRTRLSTAEDVVGGPALLIPKPLRQAMITPRNRETLRRLALLSLGRAGRTSSSSDHA